MLSKALVELQEYLDAPYEFEPEWVDGEIRERIMPNFEHARIQNRIGARIEFHREAGKPLAAAPQCRLKLPHSIRIPDVSMFAGLITEPLPATAPLVTAEISSPGDRYLELLERLHEYRDWGVQHIWVIDPEHRRHSQVEAGRRARNHLQCYSTLFDECGFEVTPKQDSWRWRLRQAAYGYVGRLLRVSKVKVPTGLSSPVAFFVPSNSSSTRGLL